MTQVTTDPYDVIRAELRRAAARDRSRAERRRRRAIITAAALASLILITGLAAAANERVGAVLTDLTQPISSVFDGPDEATEPSESATEVLSRLRRGERAETSRRDTTVGKVLLRGTIGGQDVEIAATERPKGARSAFGPTRRAETCWTVVVDGRANGFTCSPQFMPGVAVNYGVESATGRDGMLMDMTISGVAGDGVAAIEILTEDGLEPVLFAEHAFYWHSTDSRARAVEITLEDGRRIRKTQLLEDVGRPLRIVTSTRSRSAPRATPRR